MLHTEPKITVIARPQFVEPADLPVQWLGESTDGERLAEFAGRLCYMSQRNPASRTTRDYLENIKKQGHGSVLEHANYSLLLEGVSRSLTHELVRHRAGMAYSQLSQRYVDESEIAFVLPPEIEAGSPAYDVWSRSCEQALASYRELLADVAEKVGDDGPATMRKKRARQAARSVLPNAAETKIVVTGNARSWRHFVEMRASPGADVEIRRLAIAVLRVLQEEAPNIFGDLQVGAEPDGTEVVSTEFGKV